AIVISAAGNGADTGTDDAVTGPAVVGTHQAGPHGQPPDVGVCRVRLDDADRAGQGQTDGTDGGETRAGGQTAVHLQAAAHQHRAGRAGEGERLAELVGAG